MHISDETPAQCKAISDGKLSQVNAGIGSEKRVESQDVAFAAPQEVIHLVFLRCHHSTRPQRVVVRYNSSHLNQLQQLFMVLDVVLFVRINKCKIKLPFLTLYIYSFISHVSNRSKVISQFPT